MEKPCVIYLRKSQDRKGQKYSIEAQRTEITHFAKNNGFTISKEYIEVASGANEERPALLECTEYASQHNIPIIVLRVDRISRKNSHLALLMENPKLTFIIAELGISATPFQISLFGLLATEERALLSRRTKEGIARARARGVQWGTNWEPGIKKAHQANRERGRRTALTLGKLIFQMKNGVDEMNNQVSPPMSYQRVSDLLNRFGTQKPSGKTGTWTRSECSKLVNRFVKEANDVSVLPL
jgi:DNA invertase Pin-like site-specific DNA recombinase